MLGYYFTDPTHKLEDIDLRSFFANMSDESRERYWNLEERYGTISPRDDGFFGELADRSAGAFINALEGVGATANELGLGSGMQDYFRGVLNRNQQWNAPEEQGIAGYIGGAIGNAAGSAIGTIGASIAGGVIGTAAGGAGAGTAAGMVAGVLSSFSQTFGNNVQRNRAAGYSEEKAYGMAFLESGVDAAIENLPFGIVGKGGKLAVNAGRLSKISAAGKRELLNKVGKKMAAEIGQQKAQNLLYKCGKQAAVSGLGEGGEEVLQYLNSYVNRELGGDPNAEFSINELADAMAQGFIGGFGLGGVMSAPGIRHEAKMRKQNTATDTATAQPEAVNAPVSEVAGAETAQTTPAVNNVVDNDQPLFDTLITDVGNALGINIDFMDSRPDGAELEKENNGIYDKDNKTLYLNRNTYSVNPAETLGHELKHYIDDNIPELSKAFNSLLEAGKTEAGKQEVSEFAREFGITEAEGNVEFSADMFGKLFARPETWQKMAVQLDERTPGMGEKFLQTLRDFYALVKTKLADLVGTNPEAETFLNNVTDLENEAARMLAELRRRNGNSTQVENVVGAKGNTAVETVPVYAVNEEAGIAPQEVVSQTEKTTAPEEVVSAENTQPAETAVVKENLTTETAATPKEKTTKVKNKDYNKVFEDWNKNTTIQLTKMLQYQLRGDSPFGNGKWGVKDLNEIYQWLMSANEKDIPSDIDRTFVLDSIKKYYSQINISLPEVDIKHPTTPKENLEVEETPEVKSAYANLKDRSAEIGFTFDKFYEKYAPQLDAIIAKTSNQFRTLGDEIVDDWRSAAYEAMAKAYMGFDPKSGVKISTYATKAVVNAINEVNRKHKAETFARGGRVSLDQTNAQGEALHEAVADENASAIKKEQNEDLVGDYRKWKSTLKPKDQKILDLSESGLSPSGIGRAPGIGMSTQAVHTRLKELAIAARTDGELMFSRKRGQSIQKRDATLTEVAKLNMRNEVSRVIETGIPEGKYVFKNLDDKQKTIDGAIKFLKEFSRKIVPLSDGRIAYFMPDERAFERGSATAWAEYGIHAVTSSGKQIPGKEYNERLFNQNKLDNLDRIIPIIQQENVFGKFDNKNPAKDGVIFVGTSHDGKRLEVITRLDEYGNPQADLTEVTVLATNKESNIPPHKPLSEVVEAVAQHQAAGFSPSTNNNIPQSGGKSSADLEFSRKRLRQQINPIVRDGKVRDEYADLLEKKGITPEKIKEWSDKAIEWILSRGGIVNAAQEILANKSPASAAVAELTRRHILNSDVFVDGLTKEDRTKLYEIEIDARSEWGRAGRAMQINALNLKDVASVQALLNKLHKDIPPAELQKLRNEIKEKISIDIFNLPKDIVEDKPKLDAVLRAELSHKAKWHDKVYEYWINSILSGPTTHFANFLGNTANAVYELGIKRFTEALVNTVARRKDGATFGEFREIWKAFNIRNAGKAFVKALDMELLDPSGKFLENNMVAIGGKTGRVIRMPGRLLKAADAFAKAIIEPAETAAYAYRMGVQEGLTGTKLQEYIQKQLTDKDSKAYEWAKERAKELTFQQDPGSAIKRLMAAKESDGVVGAVLKLLLPFVKTPSNILRQGVRKSILGSVNLAGETVKGILGKRDFDGEYVARVAEQIIAWGIFMTVAGLSDDDDQPWITGSSASYGSAEYAYNADKIPPYSIRIGDSWYSYARIEPFATGLALMADSLKAYNNIKNGKEGTAVLKDIFNSGKQIILEKSFLNGLGEINKATQDPESFTRVVTNPAKGLVPNLFIQTRNAFIKNAPDNKSREKGAEWLKDQFWIATNQAGITSALPKVDYFGRDVQKDDWGDGFFSPVWRLTSFKRIKADSTADPAEQLIWNYNQRNPNETYYPSLPRNSFTVNGEKYYFTGKTYHDFAVDAGGLAHRQIGNAIKAGMLNINNPTEKDIELIKNIFSRARKETQQKYKHKAEKEK